MSSYPTETEYSEYQDPRQKNLQRSRLAEALVATPWPFEKEGYYIKDNNSKVIGHSSALDMQVGDDKYKSPYRDFAIQPVEFLQKNKLGWCESNAIKYLCRWKDKNGIEDLKKARHYIDLLIEIEELEG